MFHSLLVKKLNKITVLVTKPPRVNSFGIQTFTLEISLILNVQVELKKSHIRETTFADSSIPSLGGDGCQRADFLSLKLSSMEQCIH